MANNERHFLFTGWLICITITWMVLAVQVFYTLTRSLKFVFPCFTFPSGFDIKCRLHPSALSLSRVVIWLTFSNLSILSKNITPTSRTIDKAGSSRMAASASGPSSSGGASTSTDANPVFHMKVVVNPPHMIQRNSILPWEIIAVVTPQVSGRCIATISEACRGNQSIWRDAFDTSQIVLKKDPDHGYFVWDRFNIRGTDPFLRWDYLMIELSRHGKGAGNDVLLTTTFTQSFWFTEFPLDHETSG